MLGIVDAANSLDILHSHSLICRKGKVHFMWELFNMHGKQTVYIWCNTQRYNADEHIMSARKSTTSKEKEKSNIQWIDFKNQFEKVTYEQHLSWRNRHAV